MEKTGKATGLGGDGMHPVVDRMAEGAHVAVDDVAHAATRAVDALGVKGEQIKQAQERVLSGWTGHLRENPLASLGIAVAAGFLLSRLLSSR